MSHPPGEQGKGCLKEVLPWWGGQAAQPERAIISGFMILDSDSGTKEPLGVNKRHFRECLTAGAARGALGAAPAASTQEQAGPQGHWLLLGSPIYHKNIAATSR